MDAYRRRFATRMVTIPSWIKWEAQLWGKPWNLMKLTPNLPLRCSITLLMVVLGALATRK